VLISAKKRDSFCGMKNHIVFQSYDKSSIFHE